MIVNRAQTQKHALLAAAGLAGIILLMLLHSPVFSVQAQAPERVLVPAAAGVCLVNPGGSGYVTIQSAVDDPACSQVFVSAGTYVEGLEIQRDLSIIGASSSGPNATSITRPPAWSQSVVKVLGGATVTLSNLSVRDGWTSLSGGGIRNFNSNLHLDNVTVLDSFSAQNGGGIYSIGGTLTIEDSIIAGNWAAENGGGLWIDGVADIYSSLVVSNTAGTSAAITQTLGGGLYLDLTADVTLKDSLISGNILDPIGGVNTYGGGIYIAASLSGRVNMQHSTVSNNSPGGISSGVASGWIPNGTDLKVGDSTISDNTGAGLEILGGTLVTTYTVITRNSSDGFLWINDFGDYLLIYGNEISENGGSGIDGSFLAVDDAGWMEIYNSTIRDNALYGIVAHDMWLFNSTIRGNQRSGLMTLAEHGIFFSTISGNHTPYDGGGIHVSSGAELSIFDSTISGNSADRFGGGIYLEDGAGGALNSSTVTLNTGNADLFGTGDVGGIMGSGTSYFSIYRSIIAGNSTLSLFSHTPDCFGDFFNTDDNLVGVVDGCAAEFIPADNLLGTFAAPLDALLDGLADNGGPTLTHALMPGSPATGSSLNPNCAQGVDQRGAPRATPPLACDIGAYELATCPAPLMPANFAIDTSGRDVYLSWTSNFTNSEIVVYRGSDPYDLASAVEIASLPKGVSVDLDFGVLAEGQGNYFYGLRGENACGERSAPTPILGEFTFGLSTAEAVPGPIVELVTLPLTASDLPTDADSLAAYIDPNGSVKRVARWNPLTSSFIVRVVDCAVCGSNFILSPGDAVAIVYGANAPSAFSWVGTPPVPGSLGNALQQNSVHHIYVPLDQAGQFPLNAAGLLANIGGVSYVASWDRVEQSWQIYTAGGIGTNFAVVPGTSYVILTGTNTPPSWP